MSRQFIKCLPVLLTVLLLAGCGKRSEQLSTAGLSERMAAAVGSVTPSEALSALGLPDENLASPSAVGYSKSPCPELIPDGIEADSSTLSLNRYEDQTVMVQLSAVCEGMGVSEAYEIMKSQCDEIYDVYPDSAFADIYGDVRMVDGEEPLSFTERYPSEEDFAAAFDARSGDTYPTLEEEERWWTDEEKTVDFYLTVLLTPDSAVFTWTAEDYEMAQEYLHGRNN